MSESQNLSLEARFDRSLVHVRGESVRYLVVTATAPKAAPDPRRRRDPLNLALVIDASGSMQGPPLEAAKEASIRVMEQLAPSDVLSCVSFATGVHTHFQGLPLDEAGRSRARSEIAALISLDTTNLCGGWLEGCRCAAGIMAEQDGRRNRVLLLSDGHANCGVTDPAELARHADELRIRGILSSTVGIGVNYSPIQLQAIAEHGGGRMHDAERPDEIAEIVLAELDELRSTVAEDVQVEVDCPPGATVQVLGMFPEERAFPRYRCSIGALTSGGTRTVVFKVVTPPGEMNATLPFDVALRWRVPDTREARASAKVRCELRFAGSGACAGQPRDLGLALVVARLWQAALIRESLGMNRSGRNLEARDYALSQLRYFREYCQGVPGAEVLVAELEDVPGFVGTMPDFLPAEPVKEVMLGAYKCLRSEADYRSRSRPGWKSRMK